MGRSKCKMRNRFSRSHITFQEPMFSCLHLTQRKVYDILLFVSKNAIVTCKILMYWYNEYISALKLNSKCNSIINHLISFMIAFCKLLGHKIILNNVCGLLVIFSQVCFCFCTLFLFFLVLINTCVFFAPYFLRVRLLSISCCKLLLELS